MLTGRDSRHIGSGYILGGATSLAAPAIQSAAITYSAPEAEETAPVASGAIGDLQGVSEDDMRSLPEKVSPDMARGAAPRASTPWWLSVHGTGVGPTVPGYVGAVTGPGSKVNAPSHRYDHEQAAGIGWGREPLLGPEGRLSVDLSAAGLQGDWLSSEAIGAEDPPQESR